MANYCVYGDYVQVFFRGTSKCHPLQKIEFATIIVDKNIDHTAEKIPVEVIKNGKTKPVRALLMPATGLIYHAGKYARAKKFEIVRK